MLSHIIGSKERGKEFLCGGSTAHVHVAGVNSSARDASHSLACVKDVPSLRPSIATSSQDIFIVPSSR